MLTIYGYGDNEEGATGATSYPMTFVYGGRYHFGIAELGKQGASGEYWTNALSDANMAYELHIISTDIYTHELASKRYGFALRCISTPLALYWLDGIRWGWCMQECSIGVMEDYIIKKQPDSGGKELHTMLIKVTICM